MSGGDARSLLRLVQRVRAHRWRLAVSRAAGQSLWISALILTLMAVVHLSLMPVPPAWVLASALLPPAAAMLFALVRRRPGLETACRIADRQLAARSLLVSAWELVRASSTDSFAAPLVIRRAMQQLPLWQSRMKALLRYPPPPSSTFLAAAILLTAFTLLLIPVRHDPASVLPMLAEIPGDAVADRRNPMADVIQSLKDLEMKGAPEEQSKRRSGALGAAVSGAPDKAVKNSNAGPEKAEVGGGDPTGAPSLTQRGQVSEAGLDAPGNPEGRQIGGQIQSDATRSRDRAGNRPDDGMGPAVTDRHGALAAESVVIRRDPPKARPTATAGQDGISLTPSLPVPGMDTAAYPLKKALHPDGMTTLPGFDIAQRALIDRYFNRIQTAPEP